MDRSDLIARAERAIERALRRPVLAGLDEDDRRALRGLRDALNAEPDIADRVLPYVNRAAAAQDGDT